MQMSGRNMSRRGFLTMAGIGAATTAAMGLTSCSPTPNDADKQQPSQGVQTVSNKYSFETPPDAVSESDIVETKTADIVVVGAGTAGLTCAVSAAEEGKSVIVIAKDDAPSGQGGSHFAIGTKVMEENGKKLDVQEAIAHEMQLASYRVDSEQWSIFANESGAAMDWYCNLMAQGGLSCTLEVPASNCGGITEEYWGSHVFYGGPNDTPFGDLPDELNVLVEQLSKNGQDVVFNNCAKQLVRDESGRVNAVIAENQEGKYVKYIGANAVVLATGDYGNNPEMIEAWCPYVSGIPCMKAPANNTGDGHAMALWVGAAMQSNSNHAAMVFGPMDIYKSLTVNELGQRIGNERVSNGFAAMEILQQPGKHTFSFWDSTYAAKIPTYASRLTTEADTPEMVKAAFDAGVEAGTIFKADSIAELAKHFSIDSNTLQSTIDRYNELCVAGVDTDHFKNADFMIAIKEAPFYACENTPNLLVTLGGLDVTADMRVKDTEGKVIEGLWALGAVAGNFYANTYTTYFAGANLGRNVCFGYRTGKLLAKL